MIIASPKQQRSQLTLERVLSATEDLLEKRTVDELTVSEIVAG